MFSHSAPLNSNIWISFLSFVRLHRPDGFRMSSPMLGTYVWRCQLQLHFTIDLYQ